MIGPLGQGSVRLTYLLTAAFGVAGFLLSWPLRGGSFAAAFLLGALASVGNLFLFGYLADAISPEGGEKKPWRSAAFVTRYLLMLAMGYVIVRILGVSPLPVLMGLFASTAAALSAVMIEIFERLLNGT